MRAAPTVLLLALLHAGCAHIEPPPGRRALEAYLRAVRSKDPKALYDLMAPEYRKRVPLQAFQRVWHRYQRELQEEARNVARRVARGQGPRVEARVAFGGSKAKTRLGWTRSGWRVLAGLGTEAAGVGPKGLVVALIRALQSGNLGQFLELLSRSRRRALLRALSERVAGLKLLLTRPLEASGDRLRIYYGERRYLDLVLEDGVWRLYDFN